MHASTWYLIPLFPSILATQPHPAPMDLDHRLRLCCLCGDVGFPAKLFRCAHCSNRFQHSYCSNYYDGKSAAEEVTRVCDWCRSEQRSLPRHSTTSASSKAVVSNSKVTHQNTERSSGAGVPSPRPAPRRYKLLKDVMC